MKRTYTIETRLRLTEDQRNWLNNYIRIYNQLYRIMWHEMLDKDFAKKYTSSAKYITKICNECGFMQRTVNTVYRSITGRQKAVLQLKKHELGQIQVRIENYKYGIEKIKTRINNMKLKVTLNNANEEELTQYRRLKLFLYRNQFKLNKAKSEMGEVIDRIVNMSAEKKKDIIIEDLNFSKKKSKEKYNKEFNRTIHTLDYNRYTFMLENTCHRKQVGLTKVNPAYTSLVGYNKYGLARKLNRHQAASYVIARLGQGFTDSWEEYKTAA